MQTTNNFKFDGDAGSYLGIGIASFFLILFTVGFGIPWAVCMKQKWIALHTTYDGRRMKFEGSGGQLFGQFFVWWLLTVVTVGIYSFWVGPKYQKWITEHTAFE